jgi:hypothetical protein
MADDKQGWAQLIRLILQDYPGLFLVIIGLFVMVVATGAVPNAPVQGDWQKILGWVGGALVIIGLLWALLRPPGPPYGVKIVSPPANTAVGPSVIVTGTVGWLRGKQLWLTRIYQDETYYPVKKISVGHRQREWSEQLDLAKADGIGAFVMGEAGQALISQFKEAERRHNGWMTRLDVPLDAQDRYLPNLKINDVNAFGITVCATVKVTRT